MCRCAEAVLIMCIIPSGQEFNKLMEDRCRIVDCRHSKRIELPLFTKLFFSDFSKSKY